MKGVTEILLPLLEYHFHSDTKDTATPVRRITGCLIVSEVAIANCGISERQLDAVILLS